MNIKQWTRLTAALCLSLMLAAPPVAAAQATPDVSVVLNGQEVSSDTSAVLQGDTTYVQLRACAEAFCETQVTWNAAKRTATVQAPGLTLEVQEGRKYMVANGRCFYMGQSVLNRDGRILVPVRALSTAYGIDVQWDAAAWTVYLTGSSSPVQSAEQYYNADTLYWLSRIIHAESQSESLVGKIAVGNVILNRTRSSEFPNSVYSVIFDTRNGVQFTPISNGAIYNTPNAESVAAAKMCLEGTSVVPSNCLYFLNAGIAGNLWVPKNRPYITAIGNHQFYG